MATKRHRWLTHILFSFDVYSYDTNNQTEAVRLTKALAPATKRRLQ